MNGAQAMVKCLENEGVEMVFGYPGLRSVRFMTVCWIRISNLF